MTFSYCWALAWASKLMADRASSSPTSPTHSTSYCTAGCPYTSSRLPFMADISPELLVNMYCVPLELTEMESNGLVKLYTCTLWYETCYMCSLLDLYLKLFPPITELWKWIYFNKCLYKLLNYKNAVFYKGFVLSLICCSIIFKCPTAVSQPKLNC